MIYINIQSSVRWPKCWLHILKCTRSGTASVAGNMGQAGVVALRLRRNLFRNNHPRLPDRRNEICRILPSAPRSFQRNENLIHPNSRRWTRLAMSVAISTTWLIYAHQLYHSAVSQLWISNRAYQLPLADSHHSNKSPIIKYVDINMYIEISIVKSNLKWMRFKSLNNNDAYTGCSRLTAGPWRNG